MENKIKKHLESIFIQLIENEKIVFAENKICSAWDSVLKEWIDDDAMTLFTRKGGETRGTKVSNSHSRKIITTDNTPAHWVFKNLVLSKSKIKKIDVQSLLNKNEFPIAFIRKKNEYETLIGKMVADKNTRLNEQGWKLAHITPIALKRGQNISLQDYKDHHYNFLSLKNMYLIDKSYSGIAEVKMFNDIVANHKY
ncbi:MAG: hypothetical protein IT233_00560 [Bacteroidia bacterium]|nr:hypothetical protein [Bacteroidia bacterium]